MGVGVVLTSILGAALDGPAPWSYALAVGVTFAIAACVLAAFGAFRRAHLPTRIETLVARGMDEVRPTMDDVRETSPGSGEFAMFDQGMDEALDYYEEARQMLIGFGRREYLTDLSKAVNSARKRSRELAEEKGEALKRRSEAGEDVAAKQMDHFFCSDQRRALAIVDGTMEGLASIKKQLGQSG
jgi:hypothetical protein